MRPRRSTPATLICFLSACAVFLTVILIPFPGVSGPKGLLLTIGEPARVALAILAFVVTLWVTEAMPFAASGLLGMAMLSLFQIMDWKDVVVAGFGNDIVLFFLGVMILSSAIVRSGLGRRIARLIVSRAHNSAGKTLFGFLLVGCLISMWVTDMAVAGLMLPLAVAVLNANGMKPGRSNFGRALTMACAWGPIIGGIGTPAGAGPNPLVIGFLKDLAHVNVGFLDWMAIGVPAALLMIYPAWLLLMKAFPPETVTLVQSPGFEEGDKHLNSREIWTLVGFALMVFLWVGGEWFGRLTGVRIPMSLAPILGALIFLCPPTGVLTWKEAEQDMEWGGLVLIAAGVSLGTALFNTGAAAYFAGALFRPTVALPVFARAFAFSLGLAIFKVVFSSNTVTASIVMPVLAASIAGTAINAWEFSAAAGLTSSLAFILVTSTPTNVIPYSAGYFSIWDMAKVGVVMTVVASLCVALSVWLAFGVIPGIF